MKTNAATLALIEQFEGFVPHWYPDPAKGWDVPTCCYGHTDAAGEPKYAATKSKTFTPGEGRDILARDLEKVEWQVTTALTTDVTDNQFGALVSFTFNLGIGNFLKSTLLKKVNARDFAGAANEFARWNKAGGKVLAGLTRRRAAEKALFLTPDGRTAFPNTEGVDVGPIEADASTTTYNTSRSIGDVLAAIIKAILSLFSKGQPK